MAPGHENREQPDAPSSPKPFEPFVPLLLGVFAALMLAQIGSQTRHVEGASLTNQPAFWPAVSLGGMLFFAGLYMLGRRREGGVNALSGVRGELGVLAGAFEFLLWFLAYVLAVPFAGYLASTIVFCVGLAYRLGYRERSMLLSAGLLAFSIVAFFKGFLSAKIPGGLVYEFLPAAIRNFLILNF